MSLANILSHCGFVKVTSCAQVMQRINRLFAPLALGTAAFGGYYLGTNKNNTFAKINVLPKMELATHDLKVERTFVAIKPDGTARQLTGKIIDRFLEKGYHLVGLKLLVPSKALAEEHYQDLSTKPFYKGLVEYISNGKSPVVAMVFEGLDAVKTGRKLIGATNPLESEPGTIRGDYCVEIGRNIIHGSDSTDSANKEISLWFKPGELVNTKHSQHEWIYGH